MDREYKVTAKEICISFYGLRFLCIYGTHINGGYVAITNWGVSAELSDYKGDYRYNREKIASALERSPYKKHLPTDEEERRAVSRDLSQMISQRLWDMQKENENAD